MKQDQNLRRLLSMADLGLTEPPPPVIEPTAAEYAPKTHAPYTTPTPDIIAERNKTHGDFGANARISQAIKRVFRAELGWDMLTDTERESMDMIALKFSRILSGKALELQHWEDVVGYARLAENLAKHQPDV